jgi:hypothetical protein
MLSSELRLAVLLGGPLRGEIMMHEDLAAMHEALRARGLQPHEILSLEGPLDRELVLAFLSAVRDRIADWTEGHVFFHYSGHGAYAPLDAVAVGEVEPALLFSDREKEAPARWVFWHELLTALSLPPGVRLTLLPDC